MDIENNYVINSPGSNIGGIGNIVNNLFYTNEAGVESFFSGGGDGSKKGNEYLQLLLLFEDSMDGIRDAVIEKLDSALAQKNHPIWIEVTEFVNACARIVYFNQSTDDEDVRKLVNRFFTLACLPHGFEYKARIIRVGTQYFFEMFPRN